MNLHDKLCNLCLVKCKNFKSIEGNRKFVLGILLPKIEFDAIQEPVMCKKCEEVLKKCFIFKAACLRSYDYIVALVNSKDGVNLDIKDVYLRKNITNTGVSQDQDVCRFCMNLVENRFAVPLEVDIVGKGNVTLSKMIEQCLPELDLSIIKNPIICIDCRLSLENCFHFVMNCLTAEEKIKTYCESLNRNSEDKIELSGLLHSRMRTVEATDVESDTVDVIKVEKQFCVKIENSKARTIDGVGDVIKLQEMSCNDSEYNNDIGNNDERFMSSDKQKVNNEQQFTPKNMYAEAEDDNLLGTVKKEETFCGENETKREDGDFVELDDQKCILDEEIEIKTDEHDFNRIKENVMMQTRVNTILNRRQKNLTSYLEEKLLKPLFENSLKKKGVTKMTTYQYICDSCPFRARWKHTLKKHMLMHMDPSEVTMYSCEICPHRTKSKGNHKQHLITHKATSEVSMFNCDSCPFQTRWKSSFKSHMLKHMGPSITTMFKCESCPYQVKWKDAFRKHILKHRDPSEVTMFKCDSCPFQSRRKSNLKNHLLKHMDPSKVTMFNCDFCSYQTKYTENLKRHLLKHAATSDITIFKCDSCPFQTRQKSTLKGHMLTHIDPSEATMFNCDFCSFQTKYKNSLKVHLKTHKSSSEVTKFKCDSSPFQTSQKLNSPSEVKMFICDFCSYHTKYEDELKQHLITHKASSEIMPFKCDSCPFQTKYKTSLKNHAFRHMDASKVTMFSCTFCSYQTKYKKNLKQHVVIHKTSSDVKMFKCYSCPFQTRRKHSLKNHTLKHRDASEVAMFNCDSCRFQTRWKDGLKKHIMLIHIDPA